MFSAQCLGQVQEYTGEYTALTVREPHVPCTWQVLYMDISPMEYVSRYVTLYMTIYIFFQVMPHFLLLLSGIPFYRTSLGTKSVSFFSSTPCLFQTPYTVALAGPVLLCCPG